MLVPLACARRLMSGCGLSGSHGAEPDRSQALVMCPPAAKPLAQILVLHALGTEDVVASAPAD